jgi:hypothetical protein
MIDIANNENLIFGNIPSSEGVFSRKIINTSLLSGSAGIRVRFITDSPIIGVSYDVKETAVMSILGRSLTKHISCVIYDKKNVPLLQKIIGKTKEGDECQEIYHSLTRKQVCCELYLPSVQTIDRLLIKLDDNAVCKPFDYAYQKPIIFFGGKSTFCHGSTFAQAMYTQITARNLDRDFYNLSIDSFGAYYNNEVVAASTQLSPACVVSEITSASLSSDYCEKNMDEYINSLAKLGVPIVLISQPFWGDKSRGYAGKRELLLNLLQKYRKEGCTIVHIDGERIFKQYSYDCYTYSLYFINDFANYIIASELSKVLHSIL